MGIIEKLMGKVAWLIQAQKSVSSIIADRDLWMAPYRRELAERDLFSSLQAARKEGHKKGLMERCIALAQKYMAMGHTAEEVSAFAEIDVNLLNVI